MFMSDAYDKVGRIILFLLPFYISILTDIRDLQSTYYLSAFNYYFLYHLLHADTELPK